MAHCPRCGSKDVMGEKITLPSEAGDDSRRVAYDFYCRNCKLAEGGVAGEPGFDEMYERWEGESPAPARGSTARAAP